MPYVSVLAAPGQDYLHITASPEAVSVRQPLSPNGTFSDRELIVVYQREVPEPLLVLAKIQDVLASSRVTTETSAYACPAPLAIRAIELAVAAVWPPNRLRCSDCRHYFVAPIAETGRMYLACPHCHNPMLNPSWNSA